MTKRDFLTIILTASGVLTVRPRDGVASAPTITPLPDDHRPAHYKGYRYQWSGLKHAFDNDFRVGQWTAHPLAVIQHGVYRFDRDRHPPYLYVNVPGFVGGAYEPGYLFNLNGRGRTIDPLTSDVQITQWIQEGEGYLRQLIDAFHATPWPSARGNPLYDFPEDVSQLANETPMPDVHFGFTGFHAQY